jgi:hypothetical protein
MVAKAPPNNISIEGVGFVKIALYHQTYIIPNQWGLMIPTKSQET